MSETPREILTLGPGEHTFKAPEWCVRYRVHLKGADAGTADTPGEDGYAIIEMYDSPAEEQ